jgi:hypothetical protein
MTRSWSAIVVIALAAATAIYAWPSDPEPPAPRASQRAIADASSRVDALHGQANTESRSVASGSVDVDGPDPVDDRPRAISDLAPEAASKAQEILKYYRIGCRQVGIPEATGSPFINRSSLLAAVREFEELEAQDDLSGDVWKAAIKQEFLAVDPGDLVVGKVTPEDMEERFPGYPEGYIFHSETDGLESKLYAWKIDDAPNIKAIDEARETFVKEVLWVGYAKLGRYFVWK